MDLLLAELVNVTINTQDLIGVMKYEKLAGFVFVALKSTLVIPKKFPEMRRLLISVEDQQC